MGWKMQGEFTIIMPRVRGRARGLLAASEQSPCGLVLLDCGPGTTSTVSGLLAELELYARAASITTLRVTAPPQGRGAAEILSAISTLRAQRLQRIAVICASPPASPIVLGSAQGRIGRLATGDVSAWERLPDAVRVVVGLASAIGSVAEVTHGVAAINTGPVASPVFRTTWPEPRQLDATQRSHAAAALASGHPLERDDEAQLAQLLVTLPDAELGAREHAQVVGQLYGWLTTTLEITRRTRSTRSTRSTRQLSWTEVLAWLDDAWDTILMLFAERDPARAEQAWAMTETRVQAEGGHAVGASTRAAMFVREYLDEPAKQMWTRIYGSALSMATQRTATATSPLVPDEPPNDTPSAQSAS